MTVSREQSPIQYVIGAGVVGSVVVGLQSASSPDIHLHPPRLSFLVHVASSLVSHIESDPKQHPGSGDGGLGGVEEQSASSPDIHSHPPRLAFLLQDASSTTSHCVFPVAE